MNELGTITCFSDERLTMFRGWTGLPSRGYIEANNISIAATPLNFVKTYLRFEWASMACCPSHLVRTKLLSAWSWDANSSRHSRVEL